MAGIAVTVRLFALLAVSFWLVGLASPTPDPFTTALAWLVIVALALSIPVSRRVVSHWIGTDRLKRTSP